MPLQSKHRDIRQVLKKTKKQTTQNIVAMWKKKINYETKIYCSGFWKMRFTKVTEGKEIKLNVITV